VLNIKVNHAKGQFPKGMLISGHSVIESNTIVLKKVPSLQKDHRQFRLYSREQI
jgi:hypothetical protein